MRLLAPFCEAAYLLARFHGPQLDGWVRGRLWENWAAAALRLRLGRALEFSAITKRPALQFHESQGHLKPC